MLLNGRQGHGLVQAVWQLETVPGCWIQAALSITGGRQEEETKMSKQESAAQRRQRRDSVQGQGQGTSVLRWARRGDGNSAR